MQVTHYDCGIPSQPLRWPRSRSTDGQAWSSGLRAAWRPLRRLRTRRTSTIYVLHYDGTLNTQDGMQTSWPGDNTPYQINITGQGTRAAFESAIDDLKGKLKTRDLLLIHTNNHGGYDGVPGSANLCTYPDWDAYYAADFASKLAQLPKHRKMLAMMEQCHAGGFNAPIIANSKAEATSIASAAIEPNNSYVSPDLNWDPFARDWISAQAGYTPTGGSLAFNPDTNTDGKIEAEEAYEYANAVKHPLDTPNFSETAAGGEIALGQEYVFIGWWRPLVRELLEPHYLHLPPHDYYAKLHSLQPELAKLTTAIDESSAKLEKDFAKKLEATITPVFGKAEMKAAAGKASADAA